MNANHKRIIAGVSVGTVAIVFLLIGVVLVGTALLVGTLSFIFGKANGKRKKEASS